MLSLAKAAHNALWDRRLGIETVGDYRPVDTTLHHDAHRSAPLGYAVIARYTRLLQLQASDTVYDIGCGTGRPLCVFARRRVAKCVGVEMDPDLVAIARRNAEKLVGRQSDISIIQGDAATLDYHDGTVFWLYNPFGLRTLEAVLGRIHHSLKSVPRHLRFCYITPQAEQAFVACDWLVRKRHVKPVLHPTCVASFWDSVA